MGPGRRWQTSHYVELARRLAGSGIRVWVLGSPAEQALVSEVAAAGGARARAMACPLRDAAMALCAADAALCNDSGLLHVAAAAGTSTVGLYGPTDPAETAPLNPMAAMIRSPTRRTEDIPFDEVYAAVLRALAVKRGGHAGPPAAAQSR
jgi:heptosyltransferase-2